MYMCTCQSAIHISNEIIISASASDELLRAFDSNNKTEIKARMKMREKISSLYFPSTFKGETFSVISKKKF